jgi:hypothetical protein
MGGRFVIGAERAQLVMHPVLEGLAEELATRLQPPAPGQVVHDPDVGAVELGRRRDDSRPLASSQRRDAA